jgi:hypothetical protein
MAIYTVSGREHWYFIILGINSDGLLLIRTVPLSQIDIGAVNLVQRHPINVSVHMKLILATVKPAQSIDRQ